MTNRKSYTGFPTSYRWSAYVTSKSPKGGSKSELFFNKTANIENKKLLKVYLLLYKPSSKKGQKLK